MNEGSNVAEKVIAVDLQVDVWKIPEARAYREAVGVNAEYAVAEVQRAFARSEHEARVEFGDDVDVEGWEPPEGWVPPSLLNIDPDYLLGFAWIPARRADPSLTYDAFEGSLIYSQLISGFWDSIIAAAEEASVPLVENRAARRKRGPASKTASQSATTSTPSTSKPSTDSPSKSSPPQSTP